MSEATWSRKKKDTDAPKGLFRHPGGGWAIRFVCAAHHVHEEQSGAAKSVALRTLSERRLRVHSEPGWCPRLARRQEQERARVAAEREAARLTFRELASQHLAWAEIHHRGIATERSRINAMVEAFGDMKLDAIEPPEVERFLDRLTGGRASSTVNRYRTVLHAMFARAVRHGHLTVNPATGAAKFKEPEGRILFLTPEEESAVREQLAPDAMAAGRPTLDARRGDLRPLFLVSVHTGLRWSEQRRLEWRDVDLLTGLLTVRQSKSGHSRHVPMNRAVRSALLGLGAERREPDNPEERVFRVPYQQPDKFLPKAVKRARVALQQAGKDASRLDGYTWHCNRHTFASRLVMAGVDLRTVQELGGWRSLAMVQRYSHLAPDHLRAAVERLVSPEEPLALRENFESGQLARVGVS